MPDDPTVLRILAGVLIALVGWFAKSWWDRYNDTVSHSINHTAQEIHQRIEKQEQRHDNAVQRNQEIHERMMRRLESVEELIPNVEESIRQDMQEEHSRMRGELVSMSVFRQLEKRFDKFEERFAVLERQMRDMREEMSSGFDRVVDAFNNREK